jgi:hypothetical protein
MQESLPNQSEDNVAVPVNHLVVDIQCYSYLVKLSYRREQRFMKYFLQINLMFDLFHLFKQFVTNVHESNYYLINLCLKFFLPECSIGTFESPKLVTAVSNCKIIHDGYKLVVKIPGTEREVSPRLFFLNALYESFEDDDKGLMGDHLVLYLLNFFETLLPMVNLLCLCLYLF